MPASDSGFVNENVVEGPATKAAAITPSDSVSLTFFTRAIYVGGAGDISVNMSDTGSAVVFKAVPVGSILPIRVSQVLATNTTASLLIALW